jgi:two-component system, OmpR family, phosphate regulon response regulator PhoB
MPASILIVEDEPAIVEIISVNARHAGYLPLLAFTVHQAKQVVAEVLPDIIVLDWMLPDASGMCFLQDLRSDVRTRGLPVIMLTARGEEYDRVAGLEAGADDYVSKPFSPKELLARVKAVLRGRAPQLTDDPVCVNGLRLDPVSHRVVGTFNGTDVPLQLGPTEFKLLHFFLTHPERVHSRTSVLDHVWGDHVFVEDRTVDVHIKRLRAALRPVEGGSMIETVRGAGYRLAISKTSAAGVAKAA